MNEAAALGLYARQTDIFNPNKEEHQPVIILVGAGSIGSWLGFGLAKEGFNKVTCYDFDTVELHNCSNQVYPQSMIGKAKVTALGSILGGFGLRDNVLPVNASFPADDFPMPQNAILCLATDSMKSRKEGFEAAVLKGFRFIVDGRMGGQVIRVFTCDLHDPNSVGLYQQSLYSDDTSTIVNEDVRRASEEPCTARSIVDVAMMVAAKMLGSVRKYATGGKNVPEWAYDAKNDIVLI